MPVDSDQQCLAVTVEHLAAVEARIREAERRFGREPGSVKLLAVSKTKPSSAIRAAYSAGQRCFGENYPQELREKAVELADLAIDWHMIGALQSNKTRAIANSCAWVHSVDRLKVAQRLSDQRTASGAPLNVLLQVNVDNETTKSGFLLDDIPAAAIAVSKLANIRLRGLMAMPAASDGFAAQCRPFAQVRELLLALNQQNFSLDTLSMGMSADLEAAIAEGATLVRIGSAIFGSRATS